MNQTEGVRFADSIPEMYERFMVPIFFEPFAADLAARAAAHRPSRVLEIAAGTGAVTRELAITLPPEAAIIATDLNQPMLDRAIARGTARPVEWRQADAMHLPFPDESFDLVVCQFGAMFFPDKAKAFSEVRRVLKPGGLFLFNVWDGADRNEFDDLVQQVLDAAFPENPPDFMVRLPHGYHDAAVIARDLAAGGFTWTPDITTLTLRSRTDSPRTAAIALCQGTPIRNEIEARDPSRLDEITEATAVAIAGRFGWGAVDGKMQAHVVAIERE